MKKHEELFAQAKEKLVAAKALLEADAPDVEKAQELRGEAEACVPTVRTILPACGMSFSCRLI